MFKKIFNFMKGLFSKFVGLFKELVEEALPLVTQAVMGQLRQVAEDVVKDLQKQDLTNEEKHLRAFNRIRDFASKENLQVVGMNTVIDILIKLAVMRLKGTQP